MLPNYFTTRRLDTIFFGLICYIASLMIFGCGGGTYGTGGRSQEITIKLASATFLDNNPTQLQIAGVDGIVNVNSQNISSRESEFTARVNPEVPITLARVTFSDGKYQDFYFETGSAISSGEVTVSSDISYAPKIPNSEDIKGSCQAILDSWTYVVATETGDFSSEQISLIQEKIVDETLNCNQKQQAIAEIAFFE
jgi:hypothetical protein